MLKLKHLDRALAHETTMSSTPPKRAKHGCCADKACTDATCMELPAGKRCGDCAHQRRCCLMFGHTPTDTYCDWFPRRFRDKMPNARIEARCTAPGK